MSTSSDIHERDWYKVLDIPIFSSNEIIQKAARKMGLKYHPDKTSDPKDHALFILVQKAKEILLNDSNKKEIDDRLKTNMARKEADKKRETSMDIKRKRMRDELEEKLRKESSKIATSTATKTHEQQQRNNPFMEHTASSTTEESYQIKVKWKRTRHNHSDDSLYDLFKIYGVVSNVSMVGNDGNAAIVTYTDMTSASKAIDAYSTSTDYRLILMNNPLKSMKKSATSSFVYQKEGNVYTGGLSSNEILSKIKRGQWGDAITNNAVNNTVIGSREDDELISTMKRALAREEMLRNLDIEDDDGDDGDGVKRSKKKDTRFHTTTNVESMCDFTELNQIYSDDATFTLEYVDAKEKLILSV